MRVDVAVSGSEGDWILRALTDAGFATSARSARDVEESGSDAALLVIALDAHTEGAIASARASAPELHVVLVEGDRDDPRGIEADLYYPKPISIVRLLRSVETLLRPEGDDVLEPSVVRKLERPDATVQLEDVDGGKLEELFDSSDPRLRGWSPGRTMQLTSAGPISEPARRNGNDADEDQSERGVRPGELSAVVLAKNAPESEERSQADFIEERPQTATPEGAIRFSGTLSALLAAADRRIFPDHPRLDLLFPVGEDAANNLVPDAILSEVSQPIEQVEPDVLERTFFGEPPSEAFAITDERPSTENPQQTTMPRPVLSRPGSRASVPLHTPATRSRHLLDIAPDGMLARAGGVALLWKLADHRVPTNLTLSIPGGATITLGLVGDRVTAFEGPAGARVTRQLMREGRIARVESDETAAQDLLDRYVAAGTLGRFEVDRALRLARESLLFAAVVAPEARYEFDTAGARETWARSEHSSVVHGSVYAMVTEAARRSLTADDVRGLLPPGVLVLGQRADARFADARLEPELISAIKQGVGLTVDAFVELLPPAFGLPGALFVMHEVDGVRVEDAGAGAEQALPSLDAARRRILAVHALCEEGDYFAILGVARTAGRREIGAAYRARTRELSVPARALGLQELEDLRLEALRAVEDAYDVLKRDPLRQAYANALFV